MKKTYISPAMLAVKLNTRQSILTISNNTLTIDNNDNAITTSDNVWSKESTSVWDEEW